VKDIGNSLLAYRKPALLEFVGHIPNIAYCVFCNLIKYAIRNTQYVAGPLKPRSPGFVLLVSLLLFIVPVIVVAQTEVSPTEAMRAGNKSYEAGRFDEAVDIYEAIVEAGIADKALYYNLGNAYFKQGNLGRTILNYRRACRLNPRDSDVTGNLAVARAQTLDRLDTSAGSGLTNLVQVAEEWLPLREAAVLALMLWLLIGVFVTTAILSRALRRHSLWAAGILGIFLIMGLFSMANRYYVANTASPAVIIAREINVTSGPGSSEQYVVEFNLHSGAEVQIVERRPGWRQIALPGNDFKGWVPAEAVETVMLEQ